MTEESQQVEARSINQVNPSEQICTSHNGIGLFAAIKVQSKLHMHAIHYRHMAFLNDLVPPHYSYMNVPAMHCIN